MLFDVSTGTAWKGKFVFSQGSWPSFLNLSIENTGGSSGKTEATNSNFGAEELLESILDTFDPTKCGLGKSKLLCPLPVNNNIFSQSVSSGVSHENLKLENCFVILKFLNAEGASSSFPIVMESVPSGESLPSLVVACINPW